MSYLDRFDRQVRDCCGVLSVGEQVRSGFKTKAEVTKSAKILYREFGSGKGTKKKQTGEKECDFCCLKCIEKKLVPKSIREIREEEQKSIQGRAFKNRSRGGLLAPRRTADAEVQADAPELAEAGVQYSENGSPLVSASGSLVSNPYSGLGQSPNYTLSEYSSFPSQLQIESVTDDRSEDSLLEERAEIARMNALGEEDLTELYNLGVIDLHQYAEGLEQMREGNPITEILQLGMSANNPIGYTTGRGGARAGSGRPTREQVAIAFEEGMRPSEVRVVDRVLGDIMGELELEEDFELEEE